MAEGNMTNAVQTSRSCSWRASFLGTIGGSYLNLQAEIEKVSLQIALHADNGDPKQSAKNLIFWHRTGLLKLPISAQDLRRAACDCNEVCLPEQKPMPGAC
jgi:hypothetical protein